MAQESRYYKRRRMGVSNLKNAANQILLCTIGVSSAFDDQATSFGSCSKCNDSGRLSLNWLYSCREKSVISFPPRYYARNDCNSFDDSFSSKQVLLLQEAKCRKSISKRSVRCLSIFICLVLASVYYMHCV